MESTLNALGGILLNAIPTFLLFLLLHFYLKSVFFGPLEKVLKQRQEATAGARKRAEESLAMAEAKAQGYEEKLNGVRADIYKEQEEMRRRWQQEQDTQVAAAQARAKELVAEAKAEIDAEVLQAKILLEAESRALASRIAANLMGGRTA
ncbi:MAG: ATP synthase F0 subunit B [Bryobacterales bacterium]|nr:ATP synthase F0 subunit B [Bryobacterales bacterium]